MSEKPVIPTELYRSLAKDFTPQKALMNTCRYIAALEARVVALEESAAGSAVKSTKKTKENAAVPTAVSSGPQGENA